MPLSPETTELVKVVALALAGGGGGTLVEKWRTRSRQHSAGAALREAEKAMAAALQSTRAATDALRAAEKASASAAAAHKRIDELERTTLRDVLDRLITLETEGRVNQKSLTDSIQYLRDGLASATEQLLDGLAALSARVNALADRRGA